MFSRFLTLGLLLVSFSLMTLSHVFAEDISSEGIPFEFYGSQYDRMTEYAPNLRSWGPRSENYYVQLGYTRPYVWGPSYLFSSKSVWLHDKYNHINLQRPRGRILNTIRR